MQAGTWAFRTEVGTRCGALVQDADFVHPLLGRSIFVPSVMGHVMTRQVWQKPAVVAKNHRQIQETRAMSDTDGLLL